MRAGCDADGRWGTDVGALRFEASGIVDLNPLVAAIGNVHLALCVATDRVQRVELARLSACRAPRLQELAVLIKLGDARNALAVGTRTSPAAFQVNALGRAAKVKVIVGSAGVHRTHPLSRPPSPPPSRPQGSSPVAPERQSARMRPIGPESRSAGHDCSQAGEALGREREPAVVRCMRPIGLYYAQG